MVSTEVYSETSKNSIQKDPVVSVFVSVFDWSVDSVKSSFGVKTLHGERRLISPCFFLK